MVSCGETPVSPEGTLATSPITPGCVLTVGASGADGFRIPDDAIGILNVLQGPDAGAWTWVSSVAPTTIGRDSSSDLVLKAQDISREHAQVQPGAANPPTAAVADLGSRNGTLVGEAEITHPTEVPAQGLFTICDDVIQWLPLERANQGWIRGPDGRIEISRRFHTAPRSEPERVELPPKVGERTRNVGQMVMALGTPIIMGLGMFLMTRNPISLLMVLASPLVFFLQKFVERSRTRRSSRSTPRAKPRLAARSRRR